MSDLSFERRRLTTSPWLWLALTLTLITLRWCAIPTTADFGVAYEPAWRIAHGEQQYADFDLTLPPLTNYTLAGCILLFGETLWSWTIHLYAWWIAALVVGLAILLRLEQRRSLILPTILLAAAFSSPAVMDGNSYDYAVTFVSGLMILAMLSPSGAFSTWRALWIGLLAGLCVLTKQNVGAVMTLAAAAIIGWQAFEQGWRRLVTQVLAFAGGFAIGFLPPLLWFAGRAGLTEVWLQMFHDAGAGKGGLVQIAFRAMPRFIFTYGTFEHRRVVEILCSLAVLATTAVWLWRSRGSDDVAESPGSMARTESDAGSEIGLWKPVGWFLLLATLCAVTLVEAPGVVNVRDEIIRNATINPFVFFVEFVYLLLVGAVMVVVALHIWQTLPRSRWGLSRLDVPALMALLVGALTCSHAMTCPTQMIVSAPVALPCLAFLLHDRLGARRAARLCWQGALVTVVLSTLFCHRSVVFERLVPFPKPGAFAGLFGHPDIVGSVERMHSRITPHIRGRSTLWLTPLGPHSAYGGLPVRNVAVLYMDTYHARIEDRLFSEWESSPPEYVVYGSFEPAQGSVRLTPTALPAWLRQRYCPVVVEDDEDNQFRRYRKLSLWRRKEGWSGETGESVQETASLQRPSIR